MDSQSQATTVLLSAKGISKGFQTEGGNVSVLDNIDLNIRSGDSIAVVGASGIGKSTLLHIMGTLDRPDSGNIVLDGIDVFSMKDEHIARFRNRSIGFVFQFHYLLQGFTAIENVMMPALIGGYSKKQAYSYAEQLLKRVGLEKRMKNRVTGLSGGEQQRTALARALVMKPKLLLADEPTGNLDEKTGESIHDLLVELNHDVGMTTVVVTHNMKLARRMKRRITLHEGHILETEAV